MDPNETLEAFRGAVDAFEIALDGGDLSLAGYYRQKAVEHAQELDDWLSNGGFLPNDWQGKD